ncbi:MAG: FGGY-family carbohydrate kinase [Clostridiales bacterium]|nr:FGGY-family carbohydrate kinase [Clostridiales bacterium]MCI6588349.1 FGGY-family carbohydrate kinase [Clostridiales bacterium]MCI7705049.1 FGGY-family carbohydrate kinase [Clostridiales bacterium]MDY4542608.1 FGGY-family carbohydrate kinase [Candidatus Ventricola sp.]MDY4854456.1 FGGY-family carbohydrate kinase [Candidatus Ventricola sp.]
MNNIASVIQSGRAVLGLELGSTRIKCVLIGEDHAPIASGDHTWENRLENGVWTYHMDDVWAGIQDAYAALKADVESRYGVKLTHLAALGVSAMMHGYLPFDKDGKQLCEFRTWRNTMTADAAEALTSLFDFNIPQRWSIAHLYQAILNGESHLPSLARLTTLAGHVHYMLTGRHVMGVGEASGMFPIDSQTGTYDARMVRLFDEAIASKGYGWKLLDILPAVLNAGEDAGSLTAEGAKLLDPTGVLEAGALVAPPEGDAGTGMTATNAVAVRTGNVSAGTSVFAMVVLEKPLSKVYPEIDMVTTPTGKPVAMVHCNNCTSDINAWAGMLKGFCEAAGKSVSMGEIYTALFTSALAGDKDCGGVVNLPLFSGEPVVGLNEGRPMMVRTPDAALTFANFSRSLVAGAMSSLKLGMDILARENVKIDSLLGHGGYFKTPVAGQTILAASLNTPISVMETAGEGGPWGMALLAAYRANRQENQTLEAYLQDQVFAHAKSVSISPDAADAAGLEAYTQRFSACLDAQKAAIAKLS